MDLASLEAPPSAGTWPSAYRSTPMTSAQRFGLLGHVPTALIGWTCSPRDATGLWADMAVAASHSTAAPTAVLTAAARDRACHPHCIGALEKHPYLEAGVIVGSPPN